MQESNEPLESNDGNEKQEPARKGPYPVWTPENCAKALDEFIEIHKRHPHPSECNPKHNLPSRRTIERLLGISALAYYCREAPQKGYDLSTVRRGATRPQPHTKSYTTESIYETLNEFVQRERRVPATTELGKNGLPYGFTIKRVTGITARELMRQWFPEYTIQKVERNRWTAERISDAMDQFVEQYGRPPMTSELNRTYNLPSPESIESRCGMTAIEFMRERYPEYFPDAQQERSADLTMQMM